LFTGTKPGREMPNTVAPPSPDGSREWAKAKPLESRCPIGKEDVCRKLTLSYWHTGLHNWGVLSKLDNTGEVRPVSGVRHLVDTLGENVKYCECVERLTIAAHGGLNESGGFRMGDPATESWEVIGDLAYLRGQTDYSNVRSFGRAIKGVMCRNATINIISCGGAGGQAMSILAEETGCSVNAIEGRPDVGADMFGHYMKSSKGVVQFRPDGSREDIMKAGDVTYSVW